MVVKVIIFFVFSGFWIRFSGFCSSFRSVNLRVVEVGEFL